MFQTSLADCRLYFKSYPPTMLHTRQSIARCYNELGQHTKALKVQRNILEKQLTLEGALSRWLFCPRPQDAEVRDLAFDMIPKTPQGSKYAELDIQLKLSYGAQRPHRGKP